MISIRSCGGRCHPPARWRGRSGCPTARRRSNQRAPWASPMFMWWVQPAAFPCTAQSSRKAAIGGSWPCPSAGCSASNLEIPSGLAIEWRSLRQSCSRANRAVVRQGQAYGQLIYGPDKQRVCVRFAGRRVAPPDRGSSPRKTYNAIALPADPAATGNRASAKLCATATRDRA